MPAFAGMTAIEAQAAIRRYPTCIVIQSEKIFVQRRVVNASGPIRIGPKPWPPFSNRCASPGTLAARQAARIDSVWQIGGASCGERVGQEVEISGVAGDRKKKKK